MSKLLNQKGFLEKIAKPQHIKLEGSGDAYVRYIQQYLKENRIDNIEELRKHLLPMFHNNIYEYNEYYNLSGPFITEAIEDLD